MYKLILLLLLIAFFNNNSLAQEFRINYSIETQCLDSEKTPEIIVIIENKTAKKVKLNIRPIYDLEIFQNEKLISPKPHHISHYRLKPINISIKELKRKKISINPCSVVKLKLYFHNFKHYDFESGVEYIFRPDVDKILASLGKTNSRENVKIEELKFKVCKK